VEIGFIDFQGLWEGWEKTVLSFFPCFPQTGISTACFGRRDFSTAFGRPQFFAVFFDLAHTPG
jgi:hypothetical protein